MKKLKPLTEELIGILIYNVALFFAIIQSNFNMNVLLGATALNTTMMLLLFRTIQRYNQNVLDIMEELKKWEKEV